MRKIGEKPNFDKIGNYCKFWASQMGDSLGVETLVSEDGSPLTFIFYLSFRS
jgi:hypothetical protein